MTVPTVWSKMTDWEKEKALGEKLGWTWESKGEAEGWKLPDGRWFWEYSCFLVSTWEGIGLLVEAMNGLGWVVDIRVEKGQAECLVYTRPNTNTILSKANYPPAAVAEAVWKALGGE